MTLVAIADVGYGILDTSPIVGIHGHEHWVCEVITQVGRIPTILAGVVHVGIPKASSPFDEVIVVVGFVGPRDYRA